MTTLPLLQVKECELKPVRAASYLELKSNHPSVFAIRKVAGVWMGLVEVPKCSQ